MRVVVLSTHRERCGIATYTDALSRALVQRGAAVDILAPKLAQGADGDRTIPRLWARDGGTTAEALATFARVVALRPDVVHLQATHALFSPTFARVLTRLLRAARIPVFVTLHGRREPDPEAAERLGRFVRALRLGGAVPIVHNRAHASELSREDGYGGAHVVPHGIGAIEPGDRAAARAALGISESVPVIAHFGFLLPDKGIDDTLLGMAAARARLPDLHLVVVGGVYDVPESREYLERLRGLADGLGLSARVHMTGEFLPDDGARRELSAADWVVLNYRTGNSQGTSGAARFALTAGRPLALSAAPIFDDIRSAGATLYPPLAQCLEDLFGAPSAAAEAMARAQRFAAENGWDRIADRHLALYRSAAR